MAFGLASMAQGQTAHFAGVQVTVGSGFTAPAGPAVDTNGNVFVSDPQNNRILKETVSGTSYTQSVAITGIGGPNGIAIDAAGNLYVSTNSGAVLKETLSGGSYTPSSVLTGLLAGGIAVSPSGGVIYLSDSFANRVVKETFSAGGYVQGTVLNGLNRPSGLALDAAGNLYIADTGNNRIVEATLSGGTYTATPLLTGLSAPSALAMDAGGDLYTNSGSSSLLMETLSGGMYTPTILASNFSGITNVAVGPANNVFVTSSSSTLAEQILPPGNFGSVSVGNTSAAQTAVFVFDTAGSLNASAAVQVLTQGASGLDYANSGTGTCASGTNYAVGATCTVSVIFGPKFPGTRNGAIVLNSSAGSVIATAYLTGTGLGPQVGFAPVQSVLFSTGSQTLPSGIAIDGAGNIYIANSNTNTVLKETLSGGAYSQSSIGTSTSTVFGVAVDGAGSVYISDSYRVLKETLSGGAYLQSTVASGLQYPGGVAVDGAGNVYIADFGNNRVILETLSGGTYVQSLVASGLSGPYGVAVDSAGNVYIADTFNNRVLKETLSGASYVQSSIGSGLDNPTGVGLDSAGNVYIADSYNNRVLKETPSGGSYLQSSIGSGLKFPGAVVADGSGNIYIADTNNNRAVIEAVTTPPALTFAKTTYGSTSSDSPQSAVIYNNGNQALLLSESVTGASFALDSSSSCAQNFFIPVGGSCTVAADFTPQATGNQQGAIVISDDNLNITNASQSITLSGQGAQAAAVITFPQPPSPVVYVAGETATLTATINSGDAVTYSVTGPARVSGSTLTYTGAGTVTVTAKQGGGTINPDYTTNPAQVAMTITVLAANSVANSYGIPTTQVGSSSAVQTITIDFLAAATLNTNLATAIQVLTQGAPNLDFTYASGGTCAAGATYAADQTCTVDVVFSPKLAGPRYGAVVLSDASGNVLATDYLEGLGLGSQITFAPVAQSAISARQLSQPDGVAVDANGNIYIADFSLKLVLKETKVNGGFTETVVLSGSNPNDVAIDGADNLYIVTQAGTAIKETLTSSGYVASTIASGLSEPDGIAVDKAGNVYIANSGAGQIVLASLANGIYTTTVLPIAGLQQPTGVAVDPNGNIYIADGGLPTALKETLSNGAYTQSTIGSGFRFPQAIALDGAGNVYIADYAVGSIYKETLNGGSYTQSSVGSGLAEPEGLTVDGSGNLYVADFGDKQVILEPYAIPPTITFPSTATGVTSAPIATTITNLGNQPLTFPVPATGLDPSTSANFSLETNADTTCPVVNAGGSAGTLVANTSCTLSYLFAPTSVATISGSSILTDNNLNVSGAMQTIMLTGKATQGSQTAQTINFPQPTQTLYPGSATLTATASSGLAVTYTVISGPATVSGSTLTYTNYGTVVVQAAQAGNVQIAAAPSVSITINVTLAQAMIDWFPATLKVYTGTALGASVLDATDSIPSTIAYTAALLPSGSSTAVSPTTVLTQGSYALTAVITPTDTTNYAITTDGIPFTVQNMNVFLANATGSATSLYNNGTLQSSAVSGGGIGAAADSSGFVWSINNGGTGVSKFTDSGALFASYNGVGVTGGTALAIDGGGQVWITSNAGINVLTNSGTAVSPTVYTGGNMSAPSSISIDISGNLWIANSGNSSITEVIGGAVPSVPLAIGVLNNTTGGKP